MAKTAAWSIPSGGFSLMMFLHRRMWAYSLPNHVFGRCLFIGIYLIATYVLNLFDLAATTFWVNSFGMDVEGNPIGRWLYERGFVYPTKIIVVGLLLIVLYFAIKAYPRWRWVSRMLLGVYGFLAIYHVASAVYISQIV